MLFVIVLSSVMYYALSCDFDLLRVLLWYVCCFCVLLQVVFVVCVLVCNCVVLCLWFV